MPIDALGVLCAQLTRDLLAIAKFLFFVVAVIYENDFLLAKCSFRVPNVVVVCLSICYAAFSVFAPYSQCRCV